MQAIVQSATNFSEGRNVESVEAIVRAAHEIPGVNVIDYSSDVDHNRSVVTFLGAPEAVRAAILASSAEAVERIDLRRQSGEHPRIGAVDVVPLTPIQGIEIDRCVELSHAVGEDIASRLGVPVYFYEFSARHGARTRLPDIRRGGFEALASGVLDDERRPDAGPHRVHPSAGATVVGARGPLAAYNVNLLTADREIAQSIVKSIRSGEAGFTGVRALAIRLDSRKMVQVSMNVIRPDLAPLDSIYRYVESAAAKAGVEVEESEVIGAIRRSFLGEASPSDLKIAGFRDTQIIDNWL